MTFEELVDRFREKDYLMEMGAGKLSRMFKCTKDEIKEVKNVIRGVSVNHADSARILVLDIETAPIKAYVWGLWNQDIQIDRILSDWFMLTWSAKWLFSKDIMSDRLTGKEALHENDRRITESLAKLLDRADIVIAHHGDKFDMPRIRSRMLVNNLLPVSPYRQIDTRKIAAKEFGFSSNKLDALAGLFNIDHKIKTTIELWKNCLEGSNDALKEMERYNRKDVDILEKVYLRLRPWVKSHPNVSIQIDTDEKVCPICGSNDLEEKGNYYTGVNRFKTYQCKTCGALSRERTSNVTKDRKKVMLVSLAR